MFNIAVVSQVRQGVNFVLQKYTKNTTKYAESKES